jgi:ABC-type multidrug transport system ATPase subunit
MTVIASIHQPATSTYLLFDQVLLLSQGKSVYFGPPSASQQYFESSGYPRDPFLSPPESMLQLVNTDFGSEDECKERMDKLIAAWNGSSECRLLLEAIQPRETTAEVADIAANIPKGYPRSLPVQIGIQLHRLCLVVTGQNMLSS